MATKQEQAISEIIKRYKSYSANIFEAFEDFLFQEFYLPEIHKQLKKGTIPILNFESIYSGKITGFKKKLIYGVISRQESKVIGQRTLTTAVSATETFLQDVTLRVYRDFEGKLETQIETPEQQLKVIKIIIDSNDRSEMIWRIAEEKIRGIFYGNPIEFFEKDKARIGLGTYFFDNYKLALKEYREVNARRNIIIHNNGCVDRKYLREISGTSLKFDEKIQITKPYLKDSIFLLHGLSTLVVEQVIKNLYGAPKIKDRFAVYIKAFNKKYKGK